MSELVKKALQVPK